VDCRLRARLRVRRGRPTCSVTTRDPLDGINGTTVVANPYHYADNDPINKTDPSGERSTDSAYPAMHHQDERARISLKGLDNWKRLGRVEVGGFIQEKESSMGLLLGRSTVEFGLYEGDGRQDVRQYPIPIDQSRFYADLDFEKGEGLISVRHTCSVDPGAGCWAAWPIAFNGSPAPRLRGDGSWQIAAPRNEFNLWIEGPYVKFSWRVVHGDRRSVAGMIPTEWARPAFEGTLSMRFNGKKNEFGYSGSCFPSIQVFNRASGRNQFVLGRLNDAASSTNWAPPLTRGCDGISGSF